MKPEHETTSLKEYCYCKTNGFFFQDGIHRRESTTRTMDARIVQSTIVAFFYDIAIDSSQYMQLEFARRFVGFEEKMEAFLLVCNLIKLSFFPVDFVLPRLITTVMVHTGIIFFTVVILAILSLWLLIPISLFILSSVSYSAYAR